MDELMDLFSKRSSELITTLSNATWDGFIEGLIHMTALDMVGWVVTLLFLTYHGIKSQKLRLIVAKLCAGVTIFYFFLRGDDPMLAKWLCVMGINIWMWFSIGKVDEDELINE